MKTPVPAPEWGDLLERLLGTDPRRLADIVANPRVHATNNGRYRHWDTLRHLSPPEGLTTEEWWLGIKLARRQLSQPIPLCDIAGRNFTVAMPGVMLQKLRHIDQNASGQIALSEQVANPQTRRAYLARSLIEEAIRSSQLEGASTTRRVAKEMLQSGRAPRTKSERMIVNNYHAMELVRERRDEPLSPELVLELHRIVTDGTLPDPAAAGRLQRPGDERVRVFDEFGQVLHVPPPAEQLEDRLTSMCDFANREDEGDSYLHPVVRSVILHFWLAYDHPFEDGNGRTARALFYWSMLRRGYWLAEYLTVSAILQQAPAKYARSFLYTESDEGDLTYFVMHQLGVIIRAIDALHDYLQRKMQEVRHTEALLRGTNFNHRQVALLSNALRRPGASYTFRTHASAHGVVYQSARTDLLDLADRGLLDKRRVGRAFHFFAPPDLVDRLQRASGVKLEGL